MGFDTGSSMDYGAPGTHHPEKVVQQHQRTIDGNPCHQQRGAQRYIPADKFHRVIAKFLPVQRQGYSGQQKKERITEHISFAHGPPDGSQLHQLVGLNGRRVRLNGTKVLDGAVKCRQLPSGSLAIVHIGLLALSKPRIKDGGLREECHGIFYLSRFSPAVTIS